ncbi:unnamed protein product [Effrenium voratum]|nr:unnamed protein product [Effrenium voratum]
MRWLAALTVLPLEPFASGPCYSSRGCEATSARLADCNGFETDCIRRLNSTSADDIVPVDEIMALAQEVGRERLHDAALRGQKWMDRFAKAHCDTWEATAFGGLRERLKELKASGQVLLVHSDQLEDGIGARFKKALELVAAALLLGFDGAALAMPAAGGLLHPSSSWQHGPVWCHESPADGPERQDPFAPQYPLRCWRFDFQRDFLAQTEEPEGRILLWGSEGSPELSGSSSSPRFACLHLTGELEGPPWQFLQKMQKEVPSVKQDLQRLFRSARNFAAVGQVIPTRREASCGYGNSYRHVSMHVRRGDVGDASGYALTQQLGAAGFTRWLCALANAITVPGEKLGLHVFTEAGRSRGSLRRAGLPGFVLDPTEEDDLTMFHTLARLEVAPSCERVMPEVHIIVNNNPREALLCMARADVLITSLSSLSWTAAVLNSGLVLHPTPQERAVDKVHWDLRSEYLDWADNWFAATDVWDHPRELRRAVELLAEEL